MYNLIIIGKENDIQYVINSLNEECHILQIFEFGEEDTVDLNIDSSIITCIDYVLVADSGLSSDLYNTVNLVPQFCNKVLDFYGVARAILPRMTADRVMQNMNYEKYDAVVLGLSHAEVGIVPKEVKYDTANLAAGGQDLYYNFEVLKYCLEKYPEKLDNVKHVIIDMFDYTYFNYDTSLSKNAMTYFLWSGGILLPHNFNENRNVSYTFEMIEKNIDYLTLQKISAEQVKIWGNVVKTNILGAPLYSGYTTQPFLCNRTMIFATNDTEDFLNTSLISKRHEHTIIENERIFEDLIDFLYKLNSEMKVHLVLFPQYKSANEEKSEQMAEWKKYFYEKIDNIQRKYPVLVHDYKYCELSENNNMFADIDHLNYYGALKFTEMINSII